MALKPCKECNKKISTLAKVCPSCGAPSPTRKINASIKKKDPNDDLWDQFGKGTLNLGVAFWLFGVLGSFVVSLVLTLLAESTSKLFYIPFVIVNFGIIACLWECAENYKKEKLQKKQSAVWGYLTHVFCVVGGLGLINTIYDIFKTL